MTLLEFSVIVGYQCLITQIHDSAGTTAQKVGKLLLVGLTNVATATYSV